MIAVSVVVAVRAVGLPSVRWLPQQVVLQDVDVGPCIRVLGALGLPSISCTRSCGPSGNHLDEQTIP